MENQHKNRIFSSDQLPSDEQPSITCCKATPHQEKNSTNPTGCVARKALLMEDERDLQGKGLGNEPVMGHWKEVNLGGSIMIPETWSQEPFLKDWIDYSTFDALLAPEGVGFAREALIAEARRRCDVSKSSM